VELTDLSVFALMVILMIPNLYLWDRYLWGRKLGARVRFVLFLLDLPIYLAGFVASQHLFIPHRWLVWGVVFDASLVLDCVVVTKMVGPRQEVSAA
jgi:hypothetical protein